MRKPNLVLCFFVATPSAAHGGAPCKADDSCIPVALHASSALQKSISRPGRYGKVLSSSVNESQPRHMKNDSLEAEASSANTKSSALLAKSTITHSRETIGFAADNMTEEHDRRKSSLAADHHIEVLSLVVNESLPLHKNNASLEAEASSVNAKSSESVAKSTIPDSRETTGFASHNMTDGHHRRKSSLAADHHIEVLSLVVNESLPLHKNNASLEAEASSVNAKSSESVAKSTIPDSRETIGFAGHNMTDGHHRRKSSLAADHQNEVSSLVVSPSLSWHKNNASLEVEAVSVNTMTLTGFTSLQLIFILSLVVCLISVFIASVIPFLSEIAVISSGEDDRHPPERREKTATGSGRPSKAGLRLESLLVSSQGHHTGNLGARSSGQISQERKSRSRSSSVLVSTRKFPEFCGEMVLAQCESCFVIECEAIKSASVMSGELKIYAVSTEPLLKANVHHLEDGWSYFTMSASMPSSPIIAGVVDSSPREGQKIIELKGSDMHHYGELRCSNDGRLVLTVATMAILKLAFHDEGCQLSLTPCDDDQHVLASAAQRTSRDFIDGAEHLEIRVAKGFDGILALCCIIGALLYAP